MRRYTLHKPFSINHFTSVKWEHLAHKHTYFEIIFILKGSGMHHVNGHHYRYNKQDVFFLGPEDLHFFEIDEETEFSFVRFNEPQQRAPERKDDGAVMPIIYGLLEGNSQARNIYVKGEKERIKLHHLLSVLESEDQDRNSKHYWIIRDSILRTMLVILSRSVAAEQTIPASSEKSLENILHYVKQNIFYPEKLVVSKMAQRFNFAPSYFSVFFKRQTGECLKKYITKMKINLIQSRLQFTEKSLNDLADEFGYADESHLCKQFKRYTGISPSNFRKSITT